MFIVFFIILLCAVIVLYLIFANKRQKNIKVGSSTCLVNDNLLEGKRKIISESDDKNKNVQTIRKVENEQENKCIYVNINVDENYKDVDDTELIEIVQKNTKETRYETIKISRKEEVEQKNLAIERLILIFNAIIVNETEAEKKKTVDVFSQNLYMRINDNKDKNMEPHSDDEKNSYQNETVEIVLEETDSAGGYYNPLPIIQPEPEIKYKYVLKKMDEDSLIFDFNKSIRDYLNTVESDSRNRFTYIEPRTNISRFKKSEIEYSEKIIMITKHHTELDEYSKEFRYFLHYDISGDLRAIDTLYNDNGSLEDGYAVWIDLIQHGKLYFPCSSTFATVLLHQIINRMVIESADWAIVVMASIWNRYYPDFQHKEILMWIKDYWLTYENQLSYDDFKRLFKYEITFQGDKIDAEISQIDTSYLENGHILDFFNENSDYRIKKGRTVEEGYGTLLEECLLNVIKRLKTVFEEEGKRLEDYFNISEIENYEKKRDIFRRAILSEQCKKYIHGLNRQCIVSENEKYRIVDENGMTKIIFTRKRFTYDKSRLFVEIIGKVTELHLRNWIGIPAKFIVSIDDLSNLFDLEDSRKIVNSFSNKMVTSIEETVEEICRKNNILKSSISKDTIDHLLSNKKADIPDTLNDKVFSIDIGKLDKIRNDAETVKEKLIVDETNYLLENVTEKVNEIKDDKVIVDKEEMIVTGDNEWNNLWNELTQN